MYVCMLVKIQEDALVICDFFFYIHIIMVYINVNPIT
jgi:hypothetical protein